MTISRHTRVQSTDPAVLFAQMIHNLTARLDNIERRPSTIPIFDTDPSEDLGHSIWLLSDGRMRARYPTNSVEPIVYGILEWVPSTPGSAFSAVQAPDQPTPPTSNLGIYTATASQSYGNGAHSDTELFVGDAGTANDAWGVQGSLLFFNTAQMVSDLTGSTITSVTLELQVLDARFSPGVTLYFSLHDMVTPPATWDLSAGITVFEISSDTFDTGGTKEAYLSSSVGAALRDGTALGIALLAPGSSPAYYAKIAGVGSGFLEPTLRIEYVK